MTQSFKSYLQDKYTYADLDFKTPVDFIHYCNWLQSIEEFVYHQTGLKLLYITDQLYRDSYEEGMTVNEMVSILLAEIDINE